MITKILVDTAESTAKVSAVAITTTLSGIVTIFDIIPDDIGKLATLLGIVLTTVLIYTRIRHSRIEYENVQLKNENIHLENELLKSKLSANGKDSQNTE